MGLRDATDHRHPSRGCVHHGGEQGAPGRSIKRGNLPGRTERQETVHAAGEHLLDESMDGGLVYPPLPGQGRGQGGNYATQLLNLEHAS